MFNIDSKYIVHRLKMATNIEYGFPLLGSKHDIVYENGQKGYSLKAFIRAVIFTPILRWSQWKIS